MKVKFPIATKKELQQFIHALGVRKSKSSISHRSKLAVNNKTKFPLYKSTDYFFVDCTVPGHNQKKIKVNWHKINSCHESHKSVGCPICYIDSLIDKKEDISGLTLYWVHVKNIIESSNTFEFTLSAENEFKDFDPIHNKTRIKLVCKKNPYHQLPDGHQWSNIYYTVKQFRSSSAKKHGNPHIRCTECNPRAPHNKYYKEDIEEELIKKGWKAANTDDIGEYEKKISLRCIQCHSDNRDFTVFSSAKAIGRCPFCNKGDPRIIRDNMVTYNLWINYIANGWLSYDESNAPNMNYVKFDMHSKFYAKCKCGKKGVRVSEYDIKTLMYHGCPSCVSSNKQKQVSRTRIGVLKRICAAHGIVYNMDVSRIVKRLKESECSAYIVDFSEFLHSNGIVGLDYNYEKQCAIAIEALSVIATKKRISEYLSVPESHVYKIARKHGIDFSQMAGRRYAVWGHNEFKQQTVDACYWAGILAADGWVIKTGENKTGVCLALNAADDFMLYKFAEFLRVEYPIRYREIKLKDYGSYICCEINVYGNWYVKQLENHFNLRSNKTHIYCPPIFTDKNKFLSFLCGYIEGDGTITSNSDTAFISIVTASKEFKYWLNEHLERFYGKSGPDIISWGKNNTTERASFNKEYSYKVYKDIVKSGAPMWLRRKWEKFLG